MLLFFLEHRFFCAIENYTTLQARKSTSIRQACVTILKEKIGGQ